MLMLMIRNDKNAVLCYDFVKKADNDCSITGELWDNSVWIRMTQVKQKSSQDTLKTKFPDNWRCVFLL